MEVKPACPHGCYWYPCVHRPEDRHDGWLYYKDEQCQWQRMLNPKLEGTLFYASQRFGLAAHDLKNALVNQINAKRLLDWMAEKIDGKKSGK